MVNFYNKDRKVVMTLYDFYFNDEPELGIRFSANISYAFFKACREVEDSAVYFDDFLTDLKMLYEGKTIEAHFVPIEGHLEIYFKQKEYGHILVTVKLNHFNIDHIMYESTLMIQYEIDQSFLPELIGEINTVLLKN